MVKVSIATKYHSNRNYIREVPIEGKKSSQFFFHISLYELYVAQIIRTGNCITLLSSSFEINRDNFWNTHYFEDITRYFFWTFNRSFLLILIEKIETLPPAVLNRCHDLLTHNFQPYCDDLGENNLDEELQWCIIKNRNLIKDEKFNNMYELDKQNRTILLDAFEKRKTILNVCADERKERIGLDPVVIKRMNLSLVEVLNPINGSAKETLQFISQKTAEAEFEFNIFSQIERLPSGKNPYGLNGTIAAAIDFFYQLGYFKKEYTLEQIFKAYSSQTGNNIGKLKVFIFEFRQDNSYIRHTGKLKALKINKLQ